MSSFAQGEKQRKELLLVGLALALRACWSIAACIPRVNPSGTEAELPNSLGKALCTCVCARACAGGVCTPVCIRSLQRGLGSLVPGRQELLTPQPSGSSRASSSSLNSVAIAQGGKRHQGFLIFERPITERNHIDE